MRIERNIVLLRKHLSQIEQWYKENWKHSKQMRGNENARYVANAFRTFIEQLKERIILKDTPNGWRCIQESVSNSCKTICRKQHAAILQKSWETCENEAADSAEAQGF